MPIISEVGKSSGAWRAMPGTMEWCKVPIQFFSLWTVIPGRANGSAQSAARRQAPRKPGIHNHDREYGFRACAKWRIHDVHLHIGE
jgi:hypothetical protein